METAWSDTDTAEAKRIWREYQTTHDVSQQEGRTVGIDPVSGRIWFGESSIETVGRMKADGIDRPLFLVRVGYDHYLRKRCRRAWVVAPSDGACLRGLLVNVRGRRNAVRTHTCTPVMLNTSYQR